MVLKPFRGRPFQHKHENLVFNALLDLLNAHCAAVEHGWYLLCNFYVCNRELVALGIKPNAVIILDFKAFSRKLQFSKKGPWLIEANESGSAVEVKGRVFGNTLHPSSGTVR